MTRVLVTGASGHVGGAIAKGLCAAGYDVLATARRESASGLSCPYHSVDLANPAAIEEFEGTAPRCEAIVHAGACLSKDPFDPHVLAVNVAGTQRLVQLAANWNVKRLIYISGITVIGRPVKLPITEDHPERPESVYQLSKLAGEHLVRMSASSGMSASILRLPAPIGPGLPRGRILAVFVERAIRGEPLILLGKGTRRQNYLDVRDVATAVERCLKIEVSGLYHLASKTTCSNMELAERCLAALNSDSKIEFAGQPDPDDEVNWDISIEKAALELGFDPAYRLEASIRSTAREIRD